jgi:nitrite reductase (NO-forming)
MTTPLAVRGLPVLETEPARRGPDRATDRRVTMGGLLAALAFLLLAVVSLAAPAGARLGLWLPVHLALAGAAGTAIASMLPFFVAALSVGRPASPILRVASLVLVAGGAILGVAGRLEAGGGISMLAAGGAVAYVAGMALVGITAALPLRSATGSRRPLSEAAYAVGIVDILVGVSIVALFLGGEPGVAAGWGHFKVVHAWLNLFGLVTLVIAGTLVHFVPTVVGSRIRRRRSGTVAVVLLAVAAPVVAAGYVLGSGVAASAGALAAVLGAGALMLHGWQAYRDRAGWTTDPPWHRFTGGSLLAAPAWLAVATLIAASGIAGHGTDPASWRLVDLVGPLVLGFVVQVVLGSVTHLVPAIGPGTLAAHARQRYLLGRAATWRLGAWNIGVAVLTAGQLAGVAEVTVAGSAIAVCAGLATLALLAGSLRR